jgi:hypothetical protein
MASLVFLGIVVAVAGFALGAYLKISFTISREDRSGSITGAAPNRACRNARSMAGYHRLRWEGIGPRGGVAAA